MAAMLRAVGLAVATVTALLVFAAAGGSATEPSLIVFPATPESGGATQLFSVEPNGDGLTQLTTGSQSALYPAFSPGGQRIAFARFGVGIFTMNADGSKLKRLTNGARDAYPTWSPNGKKIAFVRPIGSAWKVHIMNATGGKPHLLKQAPAAGRPTWSKAGLLIPTSADLLRIDPDTGRVLKYFDADIDPIWGLNNVTIDKKVTMLTYVGTRDPIPGDMECGDGPCQRFGLFTENLTGKKHRKARLLVKDTGPAVFAPNGGRLAFVAGGALVLRAVGGNGMATIRPVGPVPVTTGPPAWR
jgi:hypothetical protein